MVTVDQVAISGRYPIPRMEDIYAQPGTYKKLDMRYAYDEQTDLHTDSRKFVTINIPRCLFIYKRLPYGLSSTQDISNTS